MPTFRMKAGPEFEAMEFDGSFECAKLIIDWLGAAIGAPGAYWSSNRTMTFPNITQDSVMVGHAIAKTPHGREHFKARILPCLLDYEEVA